MIEPSALLNPLKNACLAAGEFILSEQAKVKGAHVELKSLNSLVSYVDRQAEEMLVQALRPLFPQAGFLTEEETTRQADTEWQWIIDPLDGTTNFLHGIPIFAVSVALAQHGQPMLGVVYELGQRELFSAVRGQGAWLGGQKLKVNPTAQLSQSLLATGFPYYDFDRSEDFNHLLTYFYQNTRGLRRLGSAATDLAYVACGRFSGYFEYSLSPWDVAAGALLVEEAGGRVSDFNGGPHWLHGREIVAGSAAVFETFLAKVKSELGRQ